MNTSLEFKSSVLKRQWRHSAHVKACTVFTVLWNIIAWGSILMVDGEKISVNGTGYHSFAEAFAVHPIVAALLIFPLIGMAMIYHSLAMWVNSTQMKIAGGEFIISRGPIFWLPGDFKMPTSDIKQAYVQEYMIHSETHPVCRYRVLVQKFSGEEFEIESGIVLYEDAHHLEEWLETNLGVPDFEVPGEVGFNKAS